jgi:hypothetical protein
MPFRMMLQHHTAMCHFDRKIPADRALSTLAATRMRQVFRFDPFLRSHPQKLYCNVKETRLLVPVIAT